MAINLNTVKDLAKFDLSQSEKFMDQEAEHVMYSREKVRNHNSGMLNSLKSPEEEFVANVKGPRGWKEPKPDKDGCVPNTSFKKKLLLKNLLIALKV